MSSKTEQRANAARDVVALLQRAWQAEDWEQVAGLYHLEAQLLPTDLGPAISGRTAIVDTYREFTQLATVHRFEMRQCSARCYRHTCIVQCEFEIEYVLEGQRSEDQVTETYVLERNAEEQLQVLWRQQIVNSSRALLEG